MTSLDSWGIVDRLILGKPAMQKTTLLTLTALFSASAAFGQDGGPTWKSTTLEPGLYMLEEGEGGFPGGNLGLLTGADGIVLIDNGLSAVSAMTVDSIEKLTDGPVNFVINTHAHGDHTGANASFTQLGATVVAHDNLRQALLKDEQFDQSGIPDITFNDSVTFHLNGHTAYIFHIPSAHTDGDAAIKFPEVNVVHAGDVFFNMYSRLLTWMAEAVSMDSLPGSTKSCQWSTATRESSRDMDRWRTKLICRPLSTC